MGTETQTGFFDYALFDQSKIKLTEYDSESYYLLKTTDIS